MKSAIEEAVQDNEAQCLFSDSRAMYCLAVHYLGFGRGSEINPCLAVYWLRRSSALGYAPAAFELGNCYRRGVGISANELLACGQYRRCRQLDGFAELSHQQRKVAEDGAARYEILKREVDARMEERERKAVLERWRAEEAILRGDFSSSWRWQSALMRMVPSLACCLASEERVEVPTVSAALYRDSETHTVVVFLESSLDWISRFDECQIASGFSFSLGSQTACKIVWPGSPLPKVGVADTAYGFSLRFAPAQQSYILFPWHSAHLDVLRGSLRWILWSTVDSCPHYSVGFDSSKEAYDYLNRTFPWAVSDFPDLIAHPDRTAQIFIHSPLRSTRGESSVFFVPNAGDAS